MKITKQIKKRISLSAIAGITAISLSVPIGVQKAEAFFNIIAGAVGSAQMAEAHQMILGFAANNPAVQEAAYNEEVGDIDIGREVDAPSVELTNSVMNQLIENGNFSMPNLTLPFRWKVIPKKEFNAYCNLADFIAVNDTLVMNCHYNRDEVAAVLAHEMVHGYNQHVIKEKTKKVWAEFAKSVAGAAMANYGFGLGTPLGIQGLEFLTIKNVDVASELEADREGFYTLASAGFNPGGTCAMLERLKYYTDHYNQVTDFFNPANHPDTARRQNDAAVLLTNYSVGHVTVKDVDIYFDDKLLLRAEEEGGMDQEEMAYLIAGGIAKGLHDNETVTGWSFRKNEDGLLDFLDDNDVYGPLKRSLERSKQGTTFQQMVEAAYQSDAANGNRAKILKSEKDFFAKVEERRIKEATKDENKRKFDAEEKTYNGDTYVEAGLLDYAEKEYARAYALDKDNPSILSGKALILSKQGNYTEALKIATQAITMDPDKGRTYTARAKIYRDMGDINNALIDCNKAATAKKKDCLGNKLAGDIYDALGNYENALKEYKAYKKVMHYAAIIPEKYQKDLK